MKLVLSIVAVASCVAVAATSACSSSSGSASTSPSGDGGTAQTDGGSGLQTVTTLATGQKSPGGIVANGTNISWTTCDSPASNLNGPGSIMTMPASGGTPVALASNTDNGALLAMDATTVYWFGPDDDTIVKVPIAGGTPTTIAKALANAPIDIALDSTSVYWVNDVGIEVAPLDGGVRKNLGGALTLAGVYQQPCIAVNATAVFATTATGILSVALAGGTATPIVTGQSPNSITADATNVYWSNLGSNTPSTIMKVAATGGTPVTLATLTSPAVPVAVAVDATNVYWIEGLGDVKKVPISGGTPVSLAHAPTVPGGIAVDATSVYWTDVQGGTVSKTAK